MDNILCTELHIPLIWRTGPNKNNDDNIEQILPNVYNIANTYVSEENKVLAPANDKINPIKKNEIHPIIRCFHDNEKEFPKLHESESSSGLFVRFSNKDCFELEPKIPLISLLI